MVGARSRRALLAYLALSAAGAVVCVAIAVAGQGTLRPTTAGILWLAAIAFAVAVPWYWLAIRWIDRHGAWP